jgi:hypothetical protein
MHALGLDRSDLLLRDLLRRAVDHAILALKRSRRTPYGLTVCVRR